MSSGILVHPVVSSVTYCPLSDRAHFQRGVPRCAGRTTGAAPALRQAQGLERRRTALRQAQGLERRRTALRLAQGRERSRTARACDRNGAARTRSYRKGAAKMRSALKRRCEDAVLLVPPQCAAVRDSVLEQKHGTAGDEDDPPTLIRLRQGFGGHELRRAGDEDDSGIRHRSCGGACQRGP
jgi:hypothetical protein